MGVFDGGYETQTGWNGRVTLIAYNYLEHKVMNVISCDPPRRHGIDATHFIGNVLFMIYGKKEIYVYDCRDMIPKPKFNMNFTDLKI